MKVHFKSQTFSHIFWAIALTLTTIGLLWLSEQTKPPSLISPDIILKIEPGSSAHTVSNQLYNAHLIKNPFVFELFAKLQRNERKVLAGRYHFDKPMNIFQILRKLTKEGGTLLESVTIPEGLTLQEIASILEKSASIRKDEFISACSDSSFISIVSRNESPTTLEGYLFPSTYNIYEKMEAKKIVSLFISEFNRIYVDSLRKRAETLGMSDHEIITLASIIEKEAKVDSERPIVSSVFHNRLKKGMYLESCATVEYILPLHKVRLLEVDLKTPSPYNTYLHQGLPPGPICNPGKSSILAALYPAETDYLFFVSKGDGTHHFSKTAREHSIAKQTYRDKL